MNDKEKDWEFLLREELYERNRERREISRKRDKEERKKNPPKPWSKKSKSEKAWDIGCFGLIAIVFLSVCVGAIIRALSE